MTWEIIFGGLAFAILCSIVAFAIVLRGKRKA